ncbi:MAG: DUF427 domain-containing protein [Cyanobacteria bacterium P01_G01_bin.39]
MIHPQRIEPKPGQESVWDYPRPPRLEQSSKQIEIIFNQVKIADSGNTYRVLETSHPPSYYIPPNDIQMEYLELVTTGRSFCEWKGLAGYYNVRVEDQQVINAAWYYPQPTTDFLPIQNYVAFYPGKMDACYVDGELVKGQAGGFYGGWITQDIVGPFKGEAGTRSW